MNKDKIFSKRNKKIAPFEFNAEVADVFKDMLHRSIPSYLSTIETIESLTKQYIQPDSNCYDLGCSLGTATLAIEKGINVEGCKIFAVDKSQPMINKCQTNIRNEATHVPIEVINDDILNIEISNASVIVMNYTLQFIEKNKRQIIINRIYNGLRDGGLFLLSEKITNENKIIRDQLTTLHHDFKHKNSYSHLEISQKRAALEEILICDDSITHNLRFKKAGFKNFGLWMQHFNFASYVAIK